MKVYVVSVLAMSPLIDGTPGGGTFVESVPCLIPAETIKNAAERVREFAMDRWKLNEGWHSHQAVIQPVTRSFYEAAFTALEAGIIDDSETESPQVFTFEQQVAAVA